MLWRLSKSQREGISEHVRNADVFFKIRHFKKAIAEYNTVLSKFREMDAPKPCIAETLALIADAQINRSEHDVAAETLEEAIEEVIGFPAIQARLHIKLGELCVGRGKIADAVACFQKAKQLGASSDYGQVADAILKEIAQQSLAIMSDFRRSVSKRSAEFNTILAVGDGHAILSLARSLQGNGRTNRQRRTLNEILSSLEGIVQEDDVPEEWTRDEEPYEYLLRSEQRGIKKRPEGHSYSDEDERLVDMLNRQANEHLKKREFSNALTCCFDALRVKQDSARTVHKIGLILLRMGEFDAACDAFSQAIEMEPDYPMAINHLLMANLKKGSYDAAIEVYEGIPESYISQLRGDIIGVYIQLNVASAYLRKSMFAPNAIFRRRNLENAKECLAEVKQNVPLLKSRKDIDFISALDAYASLSAQCEQDEEFKGIFEFLIKEQESLPELHFNYAVNLYRNGMLDDAESQINEFLNRSQQRFSNALANLLLGYICMNKGEIDSAVEACKESISLNPNVTEAYYLMGLLEAQRGKMDVAMENLGRAICMDKNDEQIIENAVRLCYCQRETPMLFSSIRRNAESEAAAIFIQQLVTEKLTEFYRRKVHNAKSLVRAIAENPENSDLVAQESPLLLAMVQGFVDTSPVDIQRLIEQGYSDADWDQVGIKLELHKDASQSLILCNKGEIAGILAEIKENAIKAMAEDGGAFTVSTANVGVNSIQIKFSDTGVGMSDEELASAIEPGYTTKDRQGTGLGLYDIKRTIELIYDGRFEITSSKGQGTTITIELPIVKGFDKGLEVGPSIDRVFGVLRGEIQRA